MGHAVGPTIPKVKFTVHQAHLGGAPPHSSVDTRYSRGSFIPAVVPFAESAQYGVNWTGEGSTHQYTLPFLMASNQSSCFNKSSLEG